MALYPILFLAGALGAVLNAVVGGGSFVTFPALLAAGVPPIQANASSTFVLWPAVISSLIAYVKALNTPRRLLAALGLASLVGGVAGALLLLRIPSSNFVRLVPWLLLGATVIFTFGDRLVRRSAPSSGAGNLLLFLATSAQLAIAAYGGFFGGGMGILMLAAWSLLGMRDLHGMNALRLALSTLINGVAILVFLGHRAIAWGPTVVMVAGSILGGYVGARYAQRLSSVWLRRVVLAIAWGMTGYFFVTITLPRL